MCSYLLKNFSLNDKKLVAWGDKLRTERILKPILACFGFIVHETPSFPAKRRAKKEKNKWKANSSRS